MALSLNDVEKIAKLSRLTLTDEEKNKTLAELNDIFAMVENMQKRQYRRHRTYGASARSRFAPARR